MYEMKTAADTLRMLETDKDKGLTRREAMERRAKYGANRLESQEQKSLGQMIAEQLKNVDAVCEILDARIPVSSRNPDVDQLTAGKPRLVVLNRVDQADPEATKQWAAHFRAKGYAVLESNAKGGAGTDTVMYRIYWTAFKLTETAGHFGYANAMGVVLAIFIGLLSALQFKLAKEK